MKSGRFFVTYVVILATAAAVAAMAPTTGSAITQQTEGERKASLVQEGNAKIHESLVLQAELKAKFDINIRSDLKGKSRAHLEIEKEHWIRLNRIERREIRAKLARFLQVVNRVLEIDAQKNITVENRDQIVNSRESAEGFQRSLENFERVNGA